MQVPQLVILKEKHCSVAFVNKLSLAVLGYCPIFGVMS